MDHRKARSLRRWSREVRPMIALALPIMAGMVGQMLIGLADTIMVGRVGVVPLAAAAMVNALAHIPFVAGLGLLSSVAVLTSQAFGAGDKAEAGEVLRHGLLLAAIAGATTALLLAALRPFLPVLRQPPEVVAAAGTYLILFGSSMLPVLVAHACKQFSEALNRPWVPTFILLGGVGLNILLNWILIYGRWGAPALGLNGAGWATLIARLAIAVVLVLYVIRAPALRLFQPARWFAALSRARSGRLLNLGWPVATQHLLEVSAFVFAALMMGWINADAIAAHQIAITCAGTTFMFPLGIGMAVCIRVGQAWGAEQYARMRRIGALGLGSAALLMALFGTVFVLWGEPLARVFVHSPTVVALTVQLLLVAALFQVADGLQIVAISGLRGLSDVRIPALVAVLAYWLLAVPLGYVLAFPAGQGAVGIWIGLASGLGAAAAGLLWRFHVKTRAAVRYPLLAIAESQ
jgi:multidrug resistance protein, MATE family